MRKRIFLTCPKYIFIIFYNTGRFLVRAETGSFLKETIFPYIFGEFLGFGACLLFSAIFSFVLSAFVVIDVIALKAVSFFVQLLCSFVVGFVVVRFKKKNGLVFGGLAGLFFFVLLFSIGSISVCRSVSGFLLVRLLFPFVSGSVGGIFSANVCR